MAEDQGKQLGEDDGTEHTTTASVLTLGDPQASPDSLPTVTSTSSHCDMRTARASQANKKTGYFSVRGYLKRLPRAQRRRIGHEIRKGCKPGLTVDNVRKALHGIRWREIGGILLIPYSKLNEIKGEYCNDEECEVAVIRYWTLRDPFASWRRIIYRLEGIGKYNHAITLHHYSEELTDSSLTHSNLIAVLETVEVRVLVDCLRVPFSVEDELQHLCDNDEERRNELIIWWLQSSPYALDSWKWLSGQLLYWEEESALAAAKRYVHQTPDPTLTLNNVTAIMKDVQEWEWVADRICIPPSKCYELKSQNPTTEECKHAYWDYWLHHHPAPSWRLLAGAFYIYGQHGALEVLRMNYLKGTSESRRLFDLSMDRGFVEMFIDKMIFYGSTGVGKTSSMSVVAGETPPDTRDSTPVATRPISLYQLQAKKEVWLKYTPKQRMALCAQISKSILGQELIEVLADMIGEQSDADDSDSEQTDTEKSDDETDVSQPTQAEQSPIPTSTSQPHHTREEPTPKPLPPTATSVKGLVDPQVLKVIQEVIDEIFQSIDKCPETEDPITFLHKLLVVDCGGQPQFHEVLPIFLRKMSMIIFVIKLSEELGSHPMIEYFENGKSVGTPYRSDHTTEQLIQRGLRSLHSHRSSKDRGADGGTPKIIVIGTHKDEEHKCQESRDAKNARLRELLLPTFKKEIIYYQVGTKQVLFPMNAKYPGQKEEDMAKTIRCAVTRNRQAVPRKLPLQWLGLEIILEKITNTLKRGVLNKNECLEIARRLRLNESTLEAALMYLDELSLIFYYPEILPNHVFTNPQVLLDKISELVKVHHDMLSCCAPDQGTEEWQVFFDYALVTLEFLSQKVFEKHYVKGYFQSKDLVILFCKLYIFAEFSKGKYFVPCLLRMLCDEEVTKYRLAASAVVFPLVLHFPDGPPRQGIFCSLVCFLTSPENHHPSPWKLKMPARSVTPNCLHRNCIQFTIPGLKTPCSIVLIDTLLQFEIHVRIASQEAASKVCPAIRSAITAGLRKANITLGYTNSTPSFAFLCPCGVGKPHPATIGDEFWICTEDEDVGDKFSPSQKIWLESSAIDPQSGATPTMPELLNFKACNHNINIPREIGSKYQNFGAQLLQDDTLAHIQDLEHQYLKNGEEINRHILQEWLEGRGRKPTTWATLAMVLRDIEKGELAAKLETFSSIQS